MNEIVKVNFNSQLEDNFQLCIWRPSISNQIPPLLGKKYLFWWIAHYFNIFRNNDYSAIVVNKENKTVGLIVLTPAYFRWKFMNKSDLQITNVLVSPEYRGKGIAYEMIMHAFRHFSTKNRTFWYVTTDDNAASIKLCEKAGFQLAGIGKKIIKLGMKGLSEIKLIPLS